MDMTHSCWFQVFSLWCLASWGAPVWALSEQDRARTETRDNQGPLYTESPSWELGQRVLVWLASLAGFYSLVWLLDYFGMERCPAVGQREAEVTDCDVCPEHPSCLPRHGCSVKSSLKALGQLEEELVALLYSLHKRKVALDTGWPSEDWKSRTVERDSLPNDLVIYTIHEET